MVQRVKKGENLTNAERAKNIRNLKSYKDEHSQKIRVAFYGRVSTEHEAQLSALKAQMQWYDDQLEYNKNWVLVKQYIDEGITGTQAKKRDYFLQMLEDAKNDKFDLIVTREVCRFARNVAQALEIVEDLRQMFIEVNFVSDSIWTFEPDSLVKLGIMATLAQEESRKTSERVRAGQKISRDNGVLYGNGNILGYKRLKELGTYEIVEDEAETVRRIFELYIQGYGYTRICRILTQEKRLCANKKINWEASKIGRILSNTTYMGIMSYGQSMSSDYLHQERIYINDKSEYMLKEVNVPIIIDAETWKNAEDIRNSKINIDKVQNGRGKNVPKDFWASRLVCACGSSMRKDKWRTSTKGEIHYGFQCYGQIKKGNSEVRLEQGLDVESACDIRKVADWKLDLIAKLTIEHIWTDRKAAVTKAYEILVECYTEEVDDNTEEITKIQHKIEKLEKRLNTFMDMRADGEITREQFFKQKEPIEANIEEYKAELVKLQMSSNTFIQTIDIKEHLDKIMKMFKKSVDFKQCILPETIVGYFIKRIVVCENQIFEVDVNLEGIELKEVKTLPIGTMKSPLFDFTIDYNTAKHYKEKRGGLLRASQWYDDITVNTFLLKL